VLIDERAIWSSDHPLICSNFCRRLVLSEYVDPRFIWYQLQQLYLAGNTDQYQRATTNIRNLQVPKYLSGTNLVIPPRAEQQRIVAAIDEQFSRLSAGIASLDRASANAGTLAKSAMEAAVRSWDQVPLGEVLHSLRNGVFVSRPGTAPSHRAILRISAVRPLNLDASDVRYVPDAAKIQNEAAFRIDAGDLMFTRYNGNANLVGACAVVGADAVGLLYPDKLIRAVVNRSRAMPEYLGIALNCGPSLRAIAQRRKTTAGQVGIAGGQLLDVPVPLPPLQDQERIVTKTKSVLDAGRVLLLDVMKVRRRSEGLRFAILAAAFSGKLVPQDHEEESAAVLLVRIANERTSSNGHKIIRNSRTPNTRPKVQA
jgi:type I restriction enzyme S subunit